jgi:hypothetical protein
MGIDAHALNCLLYAKQFGNLGATVTAGRQSLPLDAGVLERKAGFRDPEPSPFAERLMMGAFGASSVESIDASDYEQATYIHDMNLPLPAGMKTYDTVVDFGTIEHVFKITQAMENLVALCREGGQILHVTPANNFCGHGFWQISPELFFSLYSERNGFRDTEVFVASRKNHARWFKVVPPVNGKRIHIISQSKVYAICRTVLDRRVASPFSVQQSDYASQWVNGVGQNVEAALAAAGRSGETFAERFRYKYFRGLSALNPALVQVRAGA